MDPKACLELMMQAKEDEDPDTMREHALNLKQWFNNGGVDNLTVEEFDLYIEGLTGKKMTVQQWFGFNDGGNE